MIDVPREWIMPVLYILLAYVTCAFIIPFIFIGLDILRRRRKGKWQE